MVYLLESMDFYVMTASKLESKVVRLQGQINIFDTALMFWKQDWQWCEIDSDDDDELEEIDMFLESDVTKYTAKGICVNV